MLLQTINDEDRNSLVMIEAADLHALKVPIFLMLIADPGLHKGGERLHGKTKSVCERKKESNNGIMEKGGQRESESSSISHSCITPTHSRKFRV
jgi:hypothetical protein